MKFFLLTILLFLSASVRCQSESDISPRCLLAEFTSRCMAYFLNYRYDFNSKLCVQFVYGGCGANENRFESLSDCVTTCKASNRLTPPARCLHSPDAGRCEALFPSTYYDSVEGKCKSFDYGGCGGNENRFSNLSECKEVCEIYEFESVE